MGFFIYNRKYFLKIKLSYIACQLGNLRKLYVLKNIENKAFFLSLFSLSQTLGVTLFFLLLLLFKGVI